MDTESRDKYYQELTTLYLLAGGHWAARQESGEMHELTHRPELDRDVYLFADLLPTGDHSTVLPVQQAPGYLVDDLLPPCDDEDDETCNICGMSFEDCECTFTDREDAFWTKHDLQQDKRDTALPVEHSRGRAKLFKE